MDALQLKSQFNATVLKVTMGQWDFTVEHVLYCLLSDQNTDSHAAQLVHVSTHTNAHLHGDTAITVSTSPGHTQVSETLPTHHTHKHTDAHSVSVHT